MSKSIEELLKLIEEKPKSKKKTREDHKDVIDFINSLGIQAGTQAVPNYLIFYTYRNMWNVDQPKKKAKKITFFQTFGKYFPDYRKNSQRYYMLTEGIFEITDETIRIAKQYDKQHWQTKKTQKRFPASKSEGIEDT